MPQRIIIIAKRSKRLTIAIASLVIIATSFTAIVVNSRFASADSNSYPWDDASDADPTDYDWGYTTCPSNDTGCRGKVINGKGVYDPWNYFLRNCTSYVAFKINEQLGINISGWGNAIDFDEFAASAGYSISGTPQVGDIAQWDTGQYGHVAYVFAVNNGVASISEYNQQATGRFRNDRTVATNGADFIHMGTPTGTTTPPPAAPTIVRVKKTITNGTSQVYTATNRNVYETFWNATTTTPQRSTPISIAQNNIVDFDKMVQPDGTQSLYTAVPDGVWETFWNSSSNGPQSAKIIPSSFGLTGVKKVVASSTVDPTYGYTHLLYVLASDGPHEFWWRDSDHVIHASLLSNINNGYDLVKNVNSSGVNEVFTVTAGAVWLTKWGPGVGLQTAAAISISQNNIVGIDEVTSPGGVEELYTAVPSGVWESKYVDTPASQTNNYIINNLSNVVGVEKKFEAGVTDQLYVATKYLVQQYWWNSTNSGGGTLINISQGNIADIDIMNGANQIYTGAGSNTWETWWDGNGIHTGNPPLVQL